MKSLLLLLTATLALGGPVAMGIETPSYTVEKAEGDLELRLYDPSIIAETTVTGDFSDAGNEGFRRLAGYIFGKNQKLASSTEQEASEKIAMTAPVAQSESSEKIAMTAPVAQSESSEKIAMTAPVGQTAAGSGSDGGQGRFFRIAFTMPRSYTLETLPKPLDERVQLRQIPQHRAAVIRYSGFWTESRYQAKREELEAWMKKQGLTPKGEPVFARYNPPWMPWFMRHNEIIWQLEETGTKE